MEYKYPLSLHTTETVISFGLMSYLALVKNYVKYDHGAWFLRKIMSSSLALCCLPSVKKQKHDFHFVFVQYIIKQLLDSVFVISRIMKFSARVISLSLRLRLITLTPTWNYSGYHKNLIQQLFIVSYNCSFKMASLSPRPVTLGS